MTTDQGGQEPTPVAEAAEVQAAEVPISEQSARDVSGWGALGAVIVLAGIAIAVAALTMDATRAWAVIPGGAGLFLLVGLTPVSPGQARVVTLFGQYVGTIRTTGLRWVNPLTSRRQVSTRVINSETATLKVNDADGNPVEIAAVVVWQVRDTAKAVYAVDDFNDFVAIQTETAVRHIAGGYPYDARTEGQVSLRQNADEITARMSEEIAERVVLAGINVIESRITRLSYAPEIAQAMLRRQQADAVVAARQRLVQGAVGMVRSALDALSEEDIVELDEERKAAMVSNLLVVLCSEQATQPVVNTGTLYQ
ncbi:band 7 protein [Catenulispora acidiphila DSM 44928]|uniref:Band 7 protein n=1 Tax=Catenulispora acidiphila (strain DSM 44928 / JCM 14897 / NBRC 102108 / NRRL B-24433 / ID139908) TaxID=479433 RepID=C7QEF1_CATAD|nr:SPFH domain-containing protein [Catenulispora acidiphila]ACU70842.1 band 7 protein [Catenulispora acidiphila DSM 44928]